MALRTTPQEYAEKWARRTSAAVPDYQKGVQRVSVAPGVAAVAKQEKLIANFAEAVSSGKWARNTQAVSLQDWKTAASEKGGQRLASGVQAAAPGLAQKAARFLADTEQVMDRVNAMPDVTLEDRIAKSAAYQRQRHDIAQS